MECFPDLAALVTVLSRKHHHQIYEGALTRLVRLGNAPDYFMLWTDENWEWNHKNTTFPNSESIGHPRLFCPALKAAVGSNRRRPRRARGRGGGGGGG